MVCWWCFSLLTFLRYNGQLCIYLKGMMQWSDIRTYCKMIITIKVIHTSPIPHVVTFIYLFIFGEKTLYKGQINTWKDVPHQQAIRKWKLQPLWDITLHQSDWLKLSSDNTKCWQGFGKIDYLCISGRNVKWYSHSGKQINSFLNTYAWNYNRPSNGIPV